MPRVPAQRLILMKEQERLLIPEFIYSLTFDLRLISLHQRSKKRRRKYEYEKQNEQIATHEKSYCFSMTLKKKKKN